MNWRNVKLIFLREVRDQLRDRRTLFMIAVLPLLLYPALGIGMVQLTVLFSEQPRTVVLLGKSDLPPPQLLEGNRFVKTWFPLRGDADRLEVVTEEAPSPTDDGTPAPPEARVQKLLQQARTIRGELEQQKTLQREMDQVQQQWNELLQRARGGASSPDGDRATDAELLSAQRRVVEARDRFQESRERVGKLFSASQMQVLILIPAGFKQNIDKVNEQLATRNGGLRESADYPRPEIVYNKADDKSQITYGRVKEVMDAWETTILMAQLQLARLPQEFPHPVHPTPTDLALEEQKAAKLWSVLFPALLVIMAVTGAFYPAVDLCAGEKERGTMETLLICPATRTELVFGKFFTVMSFSCTTALLNLLSMGMTGRHMVAMAPGGRFGGGADLSLPSPLSLLWVIVLLIPLSALFSALCLALATFARSSKEGQYYLTPLLMVTLGLTVFCLSPGVELTSFYSVMPVMGAALLLKALLLSPLSAAPLYYAIPVLITSIGYSALALWWAIDQFNREEVLFREAERFELSLWIKHLLREKEPTPSFAEAGFCFVLVMLLQFAAMRAFAHAMVGAGGEEDPRLPVSMRVLLIQQLAIVASPALFMGIMLTTSLRQTFRLHWPEGRVLLAAAVLPLALHPLTLELSAHMQWFFPPLPDSIQGMLQAMAGHKSLWPVLLTFAVAPAICEEIAFRGFILSGFNRHGRKWVAIALSSVAFGVMHMIPQQVFNAALLGLVLGLIALRSNSLLPCIVFHFLYNTLGVMHGRLAGDLDRIDSHHWFTVLKEGQLRYQWPTLVLAALFVIPLLRWLARPAGERPDDVERYPELSPRTDIPELAAALPAVESSLPKTV